MHRLIIEEVNCSRKQYFAVVKVLIADGFFYKQKDGVVYNADGDVVCFDEERVNAKTLTLKDLG